MTEQVLAGLLRSVDIVRSRICLDDPIEDELLPTAISMDDGIFNLEAAMPGCNLSTPHVPLFGIDLAEVTSSSLTAVSLQSLHKHLMSLCLQQLQLVMPSQSISYIASHKLQKWAGDQALALHSYKISNHQCLMIANVGCRCQGTACMVLLRCRKHKAVTWITNILYLSHVNELPYITTAAIVCSHCSGLIVA